MNDIWTEVLKKIHQYDSIMLFRHERADGDCVGASIGLRRILRQSYPQKNVYLIDAPAPRTLNFLGDEDGEVPDEVYSESLAIVLDSGNAERISNKKYSLCREIIKIDHHPERADGKYGDLSVVEPEKTSTSEIIAELCMRNKKELKVDKISATALYTGIVEDSGRFRFDSVTGDTLRAAAFLLDFGIDTERMYSNLYFKDASEFKYESYVHDNIHITENGLAYVYITEEVMEKFGLGYEEAALAVNCMDSIRGSFFWIAFIDDPSKKGDIRVRLRSRYMQINGIAEKHGGGGHAHASGATAHSKEEMNEIISEADELMKNFKIKNDNLI